MIYILIILLLSFGWFIYEIATAPLGREDEDGFHYDEVKK